MRVSALLAATLLLAACTTAAGPESRDAEQSPTPSTTTRPQPQPQPQPVRLRATVARSPTYAAWPVASDPGWPPHRRTPRQPTSFLIGCVGWATTSRSSPSRCLPATRGECRSRGPSANVVARPRGFDPAGRRTCWSAHTSTPSRSHPGAEDNASGIAVLLETARRAGRAPHPAARGVRGLRRRGAPRHRRPRAPLRLAALRRADVAPPSGATCAAWCRWTASASARSCRSRRCPAATPSRSGQRWRRSAERLGIGTWSGEQPASDHGRSRDAGLPAARLGSTPYAAYHSAQDLPAVVVPAQLRRVGRVRLGLARRPSPLNRQKFANIRSAAAYGTTRGREVGADPVGHEVDAP